MPEELCEAEVEHLGVAPPRDEDVRRLEVAVDDPLGVRREKRVGNLDGPGDDFVRLEAPLDHALAERLALEQLHRNEVAAFMLVDVVDRANVRVVERGRGLGLSLETCDRLKIAALLLAQELQGDWSFQAQTLGPVDDAHAAAAEFRRDAVVRKGLADHGRTGLHANRRVRTPTETDASASYSVRGASPPPAAGEPTSRRQSRGSGEPRRNRTFNPQIKSQLIQGVFVQNESERRPFVHLASHRPSHSVWAGHVAAVVGDAQAERRRRTPVGRVPAEIPLRGRHRSRATRAGTQR